MSYEILVPKELLEPESETEGLKPRHLRAVSEAAPSKQTKIMTYQEILDRTTSVASTTHTTINGEVYETTKLPETFGFTFEELDEVRSNNLAAMTHCIIDGVGVTLEVFEEVHKNVVLGAE